MQQTSSEDFRRFAAEDLRVLQHRDALQSALGVTLMNHDLQGILWGVTRYLFNETMLEFHGIEWVNARSFHVFNC